MFKICKYIYLYVFIILKFFESVSSTSLLKLFTVWLWNSPFKVSIIHINNIVFWFITCVYRIIYQGVGWIIRIRINLNWKICFMFHGLQEWQKEIFLIGNPCILRLSSDTLLNKNSNCLKVFSPFFIEHFFIQTEQLVLLDDIRVVARVPQV